MKTYDRREVATFFVDAQNGFTPVCPQELPVAGGDEIVHELNAMLPFAGVKVASGDEHPDAAHFFADAAHPPFTPAPSGTKNWDIRWNRHCVKGTFGAELLAGLPRQAAYDLFIAKGTAVDKHPYGACYHDLADAEPTGVLAFLKDRGVRLVLVGGLATDYCVKATALQLLRAGFDVIVNTAACRGITPETTEAALAEVAVHGGLIAPNAAGIAKQVKIA